MKHFHLLVIGGGSAGIASAVRAASYGKKVALIEKDLIGGTCVNLGCVPKKIMWYAGQVAEYMHLAPSFGFNIKTSSNFTKLVKQRENYIKSLVKGYKQRLQKNKITYIHGAARFVNAKTVTVDGEQYSADHIIIATGTSPVLPDFKGAELGMDSDGFFALKKQPKKIAVVGGGYIAVELASILNQLGSKVKLLVRNDKPIRNFDSTLGDTLVEIMTAQGIELLPYHDVSEITASTSKKLTLHCKKSKAITNMDAVIFAIGRQPRTKTLNLKAAGVKIDEKGYIKTNKWETTNIPHIYAIGDVAGKKLLTPVAVAAGRKLADRIFGRNKKIFLDYSMIPTAIFTHPPVASLGLSEQAASEKYGKNKITIYHAQFDSLVYALSQQKTLTKIKLITLKKNAKIIGCHLIGKNADEIIQGFTVAIKMGATYQDLKNTIGIHPTSAEELFTLT